MEISIPSKNEIVSICFGEDVIDSVIAKEEFKPLDRTQYLVRVNLFCRIQSERHKSNIHLSDSMGLGISKNIHPLKKPRVLVVGRQNSNRLKHLSVETKNRRDDFANKVVLQILAKSLTLLSFCEKCFFYAWYVHRCIHIVVVKGKESRERGTTGQ